MSTDTHATEKVIAQADQKKHEGRTLTVALDMSERSRDAFAWTVANLYRAGDKLSLVHVSPRLDGLDVFVPDYDIGTMGTGNEEEMTESQIMLANFAKYCLVNGITHEARHFSGDLGDVVGQLTSKQDGGGSALIVGNHNKNATEHFFLGSASESAVHSAHVPVVVIKRPHKVSLDPDTNRRIGICVDSSEQARAAFDWMMNEMYREDDSIFVLHMSGDRKKEEDDVTVDGVGTGAGDALMDQYAYLLAERSADYHTVHARSHRPLPESAASLAGSLDLDCLVVGARGLGAVKRTLFGSFSDGLERACKCNVIVVKS